jgi:hypothetical protein
METIKVMATVDKQGQLLLDDPLMLEEDSRVEVMVTIPEATQLDFDDDPKQEILDSLRQSLQDAKLGRTHPISELWNDLDVE